MNYNQATLFAATGSTLMLPGWQGYFKWDYNKQDIIIEIMLYNTNQFSNLISSL